MNNFIKFIKMGITKEIPYPYTWKNIILIASGLGLFQVLSTILLEPFGTDRYITDFKFLKLSGYALCFVVPFLIIHLFELYVLKKNSQRWYLIIEILFKLFLALLISTSNYFYNIIIINDISPSFNNWLRYLWDFALPNFIIFLPLIWIIYYVLWKPKPESLKNERIYLKGKNKTDQLNLSFKNFIYAKSEQNYIKIIYLKNHQTKSIVMRMSMSDLENQIPGALKIHRSFLVNKSHIERLKGNKKNRFLILSYIDKPIPVSRNFDHSVFL